MAVTQLFAAREAVWQLGGGSSIYVVPDPGA